VAERKPPARIIEEALRLEADPERVRRFYEDWAAFYDEDVAREGYVAPAISVELLERGLDARGGPRDVVTVLDAGCGTGLVGALLHARGLRRIDGFDLSPEMADVARERGVYREVRAGVDLSRPLEGYAEGDYDAAVSCGVFTSGHVPPDALAHLARVVRAGGCFAVSTRTAYCEETAFEATSERLEADGVLALETVLRTRPYTEDAKAHYWLYRVP